MKPIRISLVVLFSVASFAQQGGGPSPVPAGVTAPVAMEKSPVQIRKGILMGALDPTGSSVADLKKEEIQIMDSGQAATPVMVRKADQLPLDLGIVLYAGTGNFSQQQAAALDLVKKIIRPEMDHAFVIAAGGNRPWSDGNLKWENDVEALSKGIKALDKNTGFSDPFGYELKTDRTGLDRDSMQLFGGSNGAPSVFSVVWQMMQSDPRPVRKAVIIVRNALSHSPGFSGRYSPMIDSAMAYVIGNAQQVGIPLYVIGLEDRSIGAVTTNIGLTVTGVHPGDAENLQSYDEELERLRKSAYDAGRSNVIRMAEATGGHVWWSSNKNFSDATDGIAKDITGQYVLIFSPSLADVASPRGLKITTTHKDCRLETPTAFYLGVH